MIGMINSQHDRNDKQSWVKNNFVLFVIVLIKDNKNFLNAKNIKITVQNCQNICELTSSFKKIRHMLKL